MKQSKAQDINLYKILTYHKHPYITVSLNTTHNFTERSIKETPIHVMKAYGRPETYLYSI